MDKTPEPTTEPRHVKVQHVATVAMLGLSIIPALQAQGIPADIYYSPDAGTKSGIQEAVFVSASIDEGSEVLIAERWKQGSFHAEEYLPNDIIRLIHAQKTSRGRFRKAYLVLGGSGWTRADIKFAEALKEYILGYNEVEILAYHKFLGRARKKAL